MSDTTIADKLRFKPSHPPKPDTTLDDAFPPSSTDCLLEELVYLQREILVELRRLNTPKAKK
jgi:hypothetical protein